MAAGCTVKNMLLNQYKLAAINNMNNGKRATYVGECNKKRKRDLANLKKKDFCCAQMYPRLMRSKTNQTSEKINSKLEHQEYDMMVRASLLLEIVTND
jgi:hypothetical protein